MRWRCSVDFGGMSFIQLICEPSAHVVISLLRLYSLVDSRLLIVRGPIQIPCHCDANLSSRRSFVDS